MIYAVKHGGLYAGTGSGVPHIQYNVHWSASVVFSDMSAQENQHFPRQ
jgi:hypothetical protein